MYDATKQWWMKNMFQKWFGALSLVGCLLISGSVKAENLKVVASDATIRAPIPGMDNTVGYLTLTNASDRPITIINVTSEVAGKVEIHNHQHVDGLMKMVRVEQLKISSHSDTVFEAGGLHLMFFEVEPKSFDAKLVNVTFETQSGEKFDLPFAVKTIKMKHMHH